MYLTRLTVENLRSFEAATAELNYPAPDSKLELPNVNLLLGINGAGKTTMLRALAMGALAPLLPQNSGYVPYAMVRRSKGRAAPTGTTRVRVVLQEDVDGVDQVANWHLSLFSSKDGWQDRFSSFSTPKVAAAMAEEGGPGFFVVGYGASRYIDRGDTFAEQSKVRHPRYHRVAGLFEETVVLKRLSSWLPHWKNPGRRKQFINLLNQIIPDAQLIDRPKNGEYLFEVEGSAVPFNALSDGYRAFIGWVTDLLYQVTRAVPKGEHLFETKGLALVDEVDLHLHPEWQRTVIPSLARAMPNMQFVFTTHSPLVVGSVHKENVFVLKESDAGTVIERPSVETFGLSADQLLMSDYFGLRSARTDAFQDQLERTAKKARAGSADDAEQLLRMMALGASALSAPSKKKAKRSVRRPA